MKLKETRITVSCDGCRMRGLPKDLLKKYYSSVIFIFNSIEAANVQVEEIHIDAVVETYPEGRRDFRAMDIFVFCGKDSRYLETFRSAALFSAAGIPHFVRSPRL